MFDQQSKRQNRMVDGRFSLREQVGRGRMSSVYRAMDEATGDVVAVKLLNTMHPDEIKRELFKRETDALRRLNHSNIVGLRQSGWSESEKAFFLILDYLPYSLDRYLRGDLHSQLGQFDRYRVIREIGEALAFAHSEDVLHRDIKPSNILIDENGRPMLTDFGISKLMSNLTVGETLAAYWSGGYASPEQQQMKPTASSSDIYSLGCVFFYLLSGQEPPPDGPTSRMIDEYVEGPRPLKNVLKRMLSMDPRERPSSGSELLSALDVTRRLETLPRYFLILTRTALRDIAGAGYSTTEVFSEVAEGLLEDLGGIDLDEVYVRMDNRGGGNDIIVLGDSLRLICTPDEHGDALVVKTAQTPYMPNMDIEKGRSKALRAMWEPVQQGFQGGEEASTLRDAANELTSLLSELNTHETVGAVKQEQRNSRRDFIERWNVALSENRSRIERESSTLEYSGVEVEPYYLTFTLTRLPPDGLSWEDDTPLVVREKTQSRPIPVGNLVEVRGRYIEVARQTGRLGKDEKAIPERGFLSINVTEALTANRRQQYAVDAFLYSQMANSRLGNVIIDPSGATRSPEASLDFFQDTLSENQKDIVRKAVASNEIFLIQGPPGTGKTSVIAETVLQILRRNPDDRILLTSQSNIAVDHALARISEAAGGNKPEMVRIGRAEKIAHGGIDWTLEERARTWRNEVLQTCDPEIEKLRLAEREMRTLIKSEEELSDSESSDSGVVEEWIAEAKDLAEQLREFEQEFVSLGVDVPDTTRAEIAEVVEGTRIQLREQLDALNELLSNPVDLGRLDEATGLAEIINAAFAPAATADRNDADDPSAIELQRTLDLRRVLTQWRRVVGLTADFQVLIGRSARVVAATCLFSGNRNLFANYRPGAPSASDSVFNWTIIDEAGRATVPEILVPIVRAEKAILVGDERQLPPMVEGMRDEAADEGPSLETSLFQSLVEQLSDDTESAHLARLTTQYRMHPAIGNLISTVFYEGGLENGNLSQPRRRTFAWMPAPVTWISTSALPHKSETRSGESYANVAEADIILGLLDKTEAKCREYRRRASVGVITGYSAQVERLIAHIDPTDNERWRNLSIEVATVDSFQGRECDVILYSTVRSNQNRRIGFLRDNRRVNVALSRARDLLVIVGDDFMMRNATIGDAVNPFASVIDYIRSHQEECRIILPDVVATL